MVLVCTVQTCKRGTFCSHDKQSCVQSSSGVGGSACCRGAHCSPRRTNGAREQTEIQQPAARQNLNLGSNSPIFVTAAAMWSNLWKWNNWGFKKREKREPTCPGPRIVLLCMLPVLQSRHCCRWNKENDFLDIQKQNFARVQKNLRSLWDHRIVSDYWFATGLLASPTFFWPRPT